MKAKVLLFLFGILIIVSCQDEFINLDDEAITKEDDTQVFKTQSSSLGTLTDVNFGLAVDYGNGYDPGLGITRDHRVVEVHKSENYDRLYARVGYQRQMDIGWKSSNSYTSGVSPQVDINDYNTVVEVHKSQNNNNLYYLVGYAGSSYVSWGSSRKYTTGKRPSVAVNNNDWCVEVHNNSSQNKLYYLVGKVYSSSKKISWGSSRSYSYGYNPKVTMNSSGVVVEVHRSENNYGLWYKVGRLNTSSKSISWGSSYRYDYGKEPDIAITDDGYVIEVHRSQNEEVLWKRRGVVSGYRINWSSSERFDKGKDPAVAIDSRGELAIQAHEATSNKDLYYSTSLFIDRASWMSDEYNYLSGKMLNQICLPGSHDAGSYDLSSTLAANASSSYSYVPSSIVKNYAKAQDFDIMEQLKAGIRYFDLRPAYKNGRFYAQHTLLSDDQLQTMLNNVKTFLSGVRKELVILNFSHFDNFSNSTHQSLVTIIKQYLGNYMYTGTGTIANTTFNTFVANGPAVLIVYDNNTVCNANAGFYRNIGLYDEYSNTDSYSSMRSNQHAKLLSNYGKSGRLFMLNWTLTPNTSSILSRFASGSLESMSEDANRNLREFVADYGDSYQINILHTDFIEDASVTDCAIMLNR